ncbi:AAA family ATPase [candidate division KSB1 bacterium]|nr:AAA family ATPase [candidate division KSB1 bacterium]
MTVAPKTGFHIQNPRMQDIYREIHDYAFHDLPCFFSGPTGCGKEFAARYYFQVWKSHRKGSFQSVNCSVLAEGTAQSELFGHMRGSFTQAYYSKPGIFEESNPGVLFMDEIADLPETVQPMLLRAIDPEIHSAKRLGAEKDYSTRGVRVVGATDQPVEKIRGALLNRLGMRIEIPSLDERPEDRDQAVRHFTALAFVKRKDRYLLFSSLFGEALPKSTAAAAQQDEKELDQQLLWHPGMRELVDELAEKLIPLAARRRWPGNFRSLRIIIDTAIIRAKCTNRKEQFIREADFYFNYHADTYSELGSYLQRGNKVPETVKEQQALNPVCDKIKEVMPHLQINEIQQWAQFLETHIGSTFGRKHAENTLSLTISTRSIQNRLREMVKAGLIMQKGGRRDQYQVTGIKDLMPAHLLKYTTFLPLPAAPCPVDPEFLNDLEKTFERSTHLYISGPAGSGKSSLALALGKRLSLRRSVYYCDLSTKGLVAFFDALVEKIRQEDLGEEVFTLPATEEDIYQTAILITGYIDALFKQDREPLFILDSVQYAQKKKDIKALKALLRLWPHIHFLFVGVKMPLPLESEMTEFILSH